MPGTCCAARSPSRSPRTSDADLAVNGSYTVEDEQILVSVQCWDVAARAPVSGFLRTWRFNLAFYNSLHDEMVSRLIPRLAPARVARRRRTRRAPRALPGAGGTTTGVPSSTRTDIRFISSQDAMEVLIEGETLAGVMENGRLDWTAGALPKGSKLRVLKKLEGFHPSWQTIRVAPEVVLSPLSKTAMEGIELDWTLGQMVGLGATLRGYWKPDSLYRWFSSYLFLQLPMTSDRETVLPLRYGPGHRRVHPAAGISGADFSDHGDRRHLFDPGAAGGNDVHRLLPQSPQLGSGGETVGRHDVPAPGVQVHAGRRRQPPRQESDDSERDNAAPDPGRAVPEVSMKTIRALLVLPVVLLTLCSCGLFYASPFPLTLAQTMAQRDFSAEIDTSMEDRFQPYVIENGAARIILLVGGYPYSTDAAGKPWLFALREDLSLIDSSNLFELESMTGGSFTGSGAVVDCSGFLTVGNLRFTFTADTITPVGVTGDVGNRGGVGDRAFQAGPALSNIAQVGTSG